MESFRIGKWEMIGWEFLPADMACLLYTSDAADE